MSAAWVVNGLTVLRVALAPVFVIVFFWRSPEGRLLALAVAVILELTDLLDGFLARRYRAETALGKLFDPLADRLAHYAVLLAFLSEPFALATPWPVLLLLALVYRDATVTYLRVLAAASGQILAARLTGKVKTATQGVGILVYLVCRVIAAENRGMEAALQTIFYVVLATVAAVAVLSLVDYLAAHRHLFRAVNQRTGTR